MKNKFINILTIISILFTLSSCKLVEVVPTAKAPIQKEPSPFKKEIIKEVIKIGTISPLGKETQYLGKEMVNAIELAVSNTNNDENFPFEIIMVHEDGNCDEKMAEEKALELVTKQNVQAIIGGLCSNETRGISKVTSLNSIPFISLFSLSEERKDDEQFIYYLTPGDKSQGEKAAEFSFTDLHQKKIMTISEKSSYGSNLERSFSEKYTALGGTISASLTFEKGQTDFNKIIEFFKVTPVDGIYLVAMPKEGNSLLKSLNELNNPITIIASDTINSTELNNNFTLQNIRLVLLSLEKNKNDKWQDFSYEYQLKYGNDPGFGAPEGFDAINIIFDVIKANGYDKSMITAGLDNLKEYNGASGKIKFENNENILRKWEVLEFDPKTGVNKLK